MTLSLPTRPPAAARPLEDAPTTVLDLTPFGPAGRDRLAGWLAVRWWDCARAFRAPFVHVDELGLSRESLRALAADLRSLAWLLMDDEHHPVPNAPVDPLALHALANRVARA